MPLFTTVPWTVTDLTRHLRQLLESDGILQDIWVQGEISNLSRPASGHIYFSLKDTGAALRCVMWRTEVARQSLDLKDGMAVEIHGRIGIYEVSGQYQLYTDAIRPIGEGVLYQEFLRLKALLETEGLFDTIRKRPIPERPQRIGIVTSPSGAALQDMLNTLRRRYPLVEVVLAASPVQGEEAPVILVASLQRLNQSVHPDVIILARGGGSIEDLWAFNDERVVRAIANSIAPIITGIGHETDFTLSDFAADLRAPTPTAAAELATPVTLLDLSASLNDLDQRLRNAFSNLLVRMQDDMENIHNRLNFSSPLRRIQINRQRLDDLLQRGNRAIVHHLALLSERLNGFQQRLLSVNPSAVLERGFAVVTRLEDGRLVYHTAQVHGGDGLSIRVSDGKIDATVTKKNKPIYAI